MIPALRNSLIDFTRPSNNKLQLWARSHKLKAFNLKHSHTQTTSTNFTTATQLRYAPRSSKKSLKRDSTHQHGLQDNIRWSVIAYNLSEELKLENAERFLENFREYQLNDISNDLQEEAIMLSLRKNESSVNKFPKEDETRPLHDIFMFREGSIVFWGVPYDQQKRVLYGLASLKIRPYSNEIIQEERDHINYNCSLTSEKTRLNQDTIQLATNRDHASLWLDQFTVSHAVATSVKLGIWESILDQYIDSVGWVTRSMKLGEKVRLTRDQVFRKTGEIYELKHRINLSSDLLDLPDIYWDRADQENLFLSVMSFLNVKKRTAVMNEKLNNCVELMNLLAGHMNDKHHVRLEWSIIILILVEVLFEFARFFLS